MTAAGLSPSLAPPMAVASCKWEGVYSRTYGTAVSQGVATVYVGYHSVIYPQRAGPGRRWAPALAGRGTAGRLRSQSGSAPAMATGAPTGTVEVKMAVVEYPEGRPFPA